MRSCGSVGTRMVFMLMAASRVRLWVAMARHRGGADRPRRRLLLTGMIAAGANRRDSIVARGSASPRRPPPTGGGRAEASNVRVLVADVFVWVDRQPRGRREA